MKAFAPNRQQRLIGKKIRQTDWPEDFYLVIKSVGRFTVSGTIYRMEKGEAVVSDPEIRTFPLGLDWEPWLSAEDMIRALP